MANDIDEIKLINSQKIVEKFRDYVVSQSRANLSKGGKNVTNGLYNVIQGEVINDNGFFVVGFDLGPYGSFQDQGVRGKSSSAKAPNSPFRFGSGTGPKGGLTAGIQKWVKAKGFLFRDKKTGQMLSRETTAYLITRSIYHKGIKPSLFFTKPFEAGFKKYIDVSLLLEFGKDVETIVDYGMETILPDNIGPRKK